MVVVVVMLICKVLIFLPFSDWFLLVCKAKLPSSNASVVVVVMAAVVVLLV